MCVCVYIMRVCVCVYSVCVCVCLPVTLSMCTHIDKIYYIGQI